MLREMDSQAATNQQLVPFIVNHDGMVRTHKTPVSVATQTTAPAPATATTIASPQEEGSRRVMDRSRHHYHYPTQRSYIGTVTTVVEDHSIDATKEDECTLIFQKTCKIVCFIFNVL